MSKVAWFHGNDLLRVDDLPPEWCPWHVMFCCPICGETWLKRLHLGSFAIYTFRPLKCPNCQTAPEAFGLPLEILNWAEVQHGYQPVELLALEFLIATTELDQVWPTLKPTA